jgi:transglutaminase-like putative cysteine protease
MKLKANTYFAYQIAYPTPIIAVLSPRKDANQTVLANEIALLPHTKQLHYYDNFGNECHRMLLEKGRVEIKTECLVEVEAEIETDLSASYVLVENLPSSTLQFLLPSRYCLSDTTEIRELAAQIIKNIHVGSLQVLAICHWIHTNIQYQYGFSFSTTNSNDVLKSQIGVCRDFAHLGIALCRSINIPARMAVGFLKDLPISDLHAWFEVYIGNKWCIFDAVQEKTTGGRIVLAYGRDANDVAFITQFGNPELIEMEVSVKEMIE